MKFLYHIFSFKCLLLLGLLMTLTASHSFTTRIDLARIIFILGKEGRHNPAFMSETSPISSAFSPNPSSYSTQHTGFTVIANESCEQYQNQSSPGEICSDAVININRTSDTTGRTEEFISSPGLEMSQALRRLEEQLSLNDDSIKKLFPSMLMQLMATIHLSRCRGIQTVSCCNIIQMRNLKIVHKHVKAQIWDTA